MDHPRAKAKTDAVNSTERDFPPTRATVADRPARYSPLDAPSVDAPWSSVLVAETGGEVDPAYRVRWAVAMHRAMITSIGFGAPPVLTGKYAPGVSPAANRCAIQFLGADQVRVLGASAKPLVLLMLPSDITPADAESVTRAWRTVRKLYLGASGELRIKPLPGSRSAVEFWPHPAAGTTRLWRPEPAAVCDTREQGRSWTLEDAVALSIGLVFRQLLQVPEGRGTAWYREVAEAARHGGLRVEYAAPVRDGDLSRFVHKVSERFPIRPYRARLDLGALAGSGALVAIGQSRHLGGGLLVPFDVPESSGRES